MIVITQPNATEEQIQRIVTRVREFGLEAQISRGASRVIIGVIGPEALLREKPIAAMAGVESNRARCSRPDKLAARDSRGASSVAIGDVRWVNTKTSFSFAARAPWKAKNRFYLSRRS